MANSTIWGAATAGGTLTTTMKLPVDTSASSGPTSVQGLDVMNGVLGKVIAGTNVTLTPNTTNGTLTIAATGGGSASPLTTKGDLYGFDTAGNRIPVGTNGQILTADSTQALGVKWASAGGTTYPNITDSGNIFTYAQSGAQPALTANANTASITNGVTVTGVATGGTPTITATGTDTNVGLSITTKGTGNFTVTTGGTNIYNSTGNFQVQINGAAKLTVAASAVTVAASATFNASGAAAFASTVSLNGVTSATGGLYEKKIILPTTAATTLTAATTGEVVTNTGATAQVVETLPASAVGLTYEGYCQNTNGIQFKAVGSDVIELGGTRGAAAGTVTSSTVGSYITLVCAVAGVWSTKASVGSWTIA